MNAIPSKELEKDLVARLIRGEEGAYAIFNEPDDYRKEASVNVLQDGTYNKGYQNTGTQKPMQVLIRK